ncbi:MAG: hypothetical protein IKE94_06700 [Aeriscardovia sp.]|nr:hypothetical protein [Aeriscardovia sp.]
MRKKLAKWIGSLILISMILTSVCPLSVFAEENTTTEVAEEQTADPSFEQQKEINVEVVAEEETAAAVSSAQAFSESNLKEEGDLSADSEKSTEAEEQILLAEGEEIKEAPSKNIDVQQMVPENEEAETVQEAEDTEEEEAKAAPKAALTAVPEAENSRIELSVTNNTGMFKVVTAYLETNNGKTELVAALSSTGYQNLFSGTYEEAVANGDNRSAWISSFVDENGRYAFRIPITEGKTYYPIVAISQSYVEKYEKGQNVLARAFFPRQFVLDIEAKTLVTGDYEFSQPLEITNNVKMFKPEEASLETVGGPNSNNYKADLKLTMGSDSFDKVFVGTAEAAAKAAKTIAIEDKIVMIPVKWVETFGDPDSLVSLLENPFITSWHSVKNDTWYERKFTVDEKEGTLVIDDVTDEDKPDDPEPDDPTPDDPTPDDPTPDDPKQDDQDALDGGTAAVDNSTSLPDGVYTPDSFSFSGGSGRATITCRQVTVQNGQAYATIAFSSKNYGYVKAAGGIYYPTFEGGVSNFTIPVQLNQNNTIIGMTTAMSAAHEVAYTIFVYIAAAEGKDAADVKDNETIGESNKMDETAPTIVGVSGGEEIKLEHAEYLKMFSYDNGMVLIEIDRAKDTALEAEETAKEEPKVEEIEEEEAANVGVEDEEGSSTQKVKTTADFQMELYQASVVKYLIVPEGVELPAGLDKKAIIIRLPKTSVYVSSDEAATDFESLGLLDLIKATGVTEDTCKNEALKALLKDKKVISAGTLADLNYTELLKAKVDLVIGAGDDLFSKKTDNDKAAKEYQEQYTKLSERLALLDIPMLIDRSADEKNPKGQLEWLKLYGVLFGKEDEADSLIAKGLN